MGRKEFSNFETTRQSAHRENCNGCSERLNSDFLSGLWKMVGEWPRMRDFCNKQPPFQSQTLAVAIPSDRVIPPPHKIKTHWQIVVLNYTRFRFRFDRNICGVLTILYYNLFEFESPVLRAFYLWRDWVLSVSFDLVMPVNWLGEYA